MATLPGQNYKQLKKLPMGADGDVGPEPAGGSQLQPLGTATPTPAAKPPRPPASPAFSPAAASYMPVTQTVPSGVSLGQPSTNTAPGYNPATGTTSLANMLAAKTATPTPTATPATTAPTPATPTSAGGTTADDMVAAQWAAIEQSLGGMLPEQLRDVDRQTALNARRANEMNALMGGNVSGAWGSGQAQAQLGGMAMRQNAIVENQKTQMNMRMSYLQTLADRAAQQERLASSEEEAEKARNLQRELQTLIDSTSIIIAQLNAGAVPGADTGNSAVSSTTTGSGALGSPTNASKQQPGFGG